MERQSSFIAFDSSKRSTSNLLQRSASTTDTSEPRQFNLRKNMETIIKEMRRLASKGSMHIPDKFWEFAGSDIMVHFLKSAILYMFTFVQLLKLQQQSMISQASETKTKTEVAEFSEEPARQRTIKLKKQHLKTHASRFGVIYSKIILYCSNFENPKEDQRLFECIYYCTCAVLKLGVVNQYWRAVEIELGYIFRGEAFNVNLKNDETQSPDLTTNRWQDSSRHDDDDDDENAHGPEHGGPSRFQYITSAEDTHAHFCLLKAQVKRNINRAVTLRHRMIHMRRQKLLQIIKDQEKQKKHQHEITGTLGLLHIASPRTPNRPKTKTTRHPTRINQFSRASIANAVHARSPAVAQFLPTSKDRVQQILLKIDHTRHNISRTSKSNASSIKIKSDIIGPGTTTVRHHEPGQLILS